MTDPFRIAGHAVVANSGGKTSGYNLWRHLEANGGHLTDKGFALFNNTGFEQRATLDFLAEQERRWGVEIVVCEFTRRKATAGTSGRRGRFSRSGILNLWRADAMSHRYCTGCVSESGGPVELIHRESKEIGRCVTCRQVDIVAWAKAYKAERLGQKKMAARLRIYRETCASSLDRVGA